MPSLPHASINGQIELTQFKLVGSGQLTWLGMKVYDAGLYSPDGACQPDLPHTIQINYQFSFRSWRSQSMAVDIGLFCREFQFTD